MSRSVGRRIARSESMVEEPAGPIRPVASRFVWFFHALLLLETLCSVPEAVALDLTRAVVVASKDLPGPESKAVAMLVEEVEKRTQIRWERGTARPLSGVPAIVLGQLAAVESLVGPYLDESSRDVGVSGAEGFRIRIRQGREGPSVCVIGNDARGVLFGVGYLLRSLRMEKGRVTLPDELNVATAPKYPLRGHQLGYRPKTHSYDAWDVGIWEQYLRDLVVFGVNAIELIPPRSDDAADSPHFPLPPMRMMVEMSKLADAYGLDVWVWYPAMDKDYSEPETVDFALREWSEVFRQLPRLDAVFVPGGDPGHTRPTHLMALLEKQTASLHRFHPNAQMWVSPQSFNQEWLEEFLQILNREQPPWLSGVVFGPQVRIGLPELRAAVPSRYPIRHYPDITHSRQCQYPVPDWDAAYALTEGRECINPRPEDEAAIFRLLQPHTVGFITYSEGCNDDVNKVIWSALGWNPETPVTNILRQYSRYFIGEREADEFAIGLLELERNWRGPLLTNGNVETTLGLFQRLEKSAAPRVRLNWRFQQALFRAYFDAYTRRRLIYESELEDRAMETLRQAPATGASNAIREAQAILDRARSVPVSGECRARIFELGEALFQSIRMQLSVERYQAISVDRGASLDTVDYPLNNRRWLSERFRAIQKQPMEQERLESIDRILNWTHPGPGGFYDDLGNVARQTHLVRGLPFAQDPAGLSSAKVGFGGGDAANEREETPEGALRKSWMDHAESLNDQPLHLRYTELDPSAEYKIRVVYGGDSPKRKIRLVANGSTEIHSFITKPFPYQPIEFDIPAEATRNGELNLSWYREPGLGGNGRGCQVSEIWLIRKQP